MSKTYDALMKLLEDKGSIPDDEAAKLIQEHGQMDEEERKKIASAIKMAKVLGKDKDEKVQDKKNEETNKDSAEKKDEASDGDEVSMDDYLLALSVLDSDEAGKEEQEKAQKVKDKFESQ
ncbi:MAG: hypothetical protein JXB07_16090 [Anaerolineae bacterium]|nr:hypothetical protein [Anaerolineae bacterium]